MLWAKHFYFIIISKLSNHMTRTKKQHWRFKSLNILIFHQTWWITSIKEQLWRWGHHKYFGSPWTAVWVVSDLLMRPETRSVDTRAANFTELPPGYEEYFGEPKHSWKSIREKMFTQHRSIWRDWGKHFECSLECNLTI